MGLRIFQVQAISEHYALLLETVISCCSDLMMSPGIMIFMGGANSRITHISKETIFMQIFLVIHQEKGKVGGGGGARPIEQRHYIALKNVFLAMACSLWKEELSLSPLFSFLSCIKQNDKSS